MIDRFDAAAPDFRGLKHTVVLGPHIDQPDADTTDLSFSPTMGRKVKSVRLIDGALIRGRRQDLISRSIVSMDTDNKSIANAQGRCYGRSVICGNKQCKSSIEYLRGLCKEAYVICRELSVTETLPWRQMGSYRDRREHLRPNLDHLWLTGLQIVAHRNRLPGVYVLAREIRSEPAHHVDRRTNKPLPAPPRRSAKAPDVLHVPACIFLATPRGLISDEFSDDKNLFDVMAAMLKRAQSRYLYRANLCAVSAAALRWILSRYGTRKQATDRIKLLPKETVVLLDGNRFKLNRKKFEFEIVKALVDAAGDWRSSKELCPHKKVRVDRDIKSLPQKLRQIIESRPGRGYHMTIFTA
ncbi:MAG: hypothetical protein IT445_07460 [Phycisphaeraceae bacterium]|nr:hypothetical protein [Phycisphaeraceae bacterium]